MHSYTNYFPTRSAHDQLDVVPLLHAGLRDNGERTLIVFNGVQTSFADMSRRVADMQHWLAARGIRPGDRVALMLENGLEHMSLIYALMLGGIVWVPVNTRLKAAGISYLLGHCTPDLFIAQRSFSEALADISDLDDKLVWLDQVQAAPADAPRQPQAGVVTHDQPLCLIYTSGTTGAPKGVIFTHRMMRIASEATLIVSDVQAGDRMFVWEPLCHIGGAQMLLVPFLQKTELHIVERFSSSKFWQQVATAEATHLHYLGGILDILAQLPQEQQPAQHSIRVAWGAGVSAKAWDGILERLKLSLRECYGMTEGSSFATVNASGKAGSIGRALPWLQVELLDAAGLAVATGEIGQVVVSSAIEGCFLPGYLDNPKATAEALQGGKLHTGDLARMDADGDLYFVGRKTDSMRVRGENVSAWEIERVFVMHPAIAAAAALGVDSAVGEQEIMLYVQFKDGQACSFDTLAEWARSRLASYQLPRYYLQVAAFETTLSERIKKHLLQRDIGAAWDRQTMQQRVGATAR